MGLTKDGADYPKRWMLIKSGLKMALTLIWESQKHSKEITMVNEHKNVGVPIVA